tara:strand:- start:635 stop:1180 length:546 start_codon:yes stop_codon:yes gene_type:complete
MQSGNQKSILNITQKAILVLFIILTTVSLFLFRNLSFQPTILLKSFGELSINPEVAFNNNKPTFMEFYADWCEVCKEMAPKVSVLKNEYENDINFVFLNVDNPKWENYIRKFNVNGIPQINLFNEEGNLEASYIGKQEEQTIKGSLDSLKKGAKYQQEIVNSEVSLLKQNKNYQVSPRSHG